MIAIDKEVGAGLQMKMTLDLTMKQLKKMQVQAGVTQEKWQSAVDEAENHFLRPNATNGPLFFCSSNEGNLTCAAHL